MANHRITSVLALFTTIVLISGSGVTVGPMQIRLFDFGVATLLIVFLFSEQNLIFRRGYLFFYIVFGLLLFYSVLLLPIQSHSQIASILQIIELAEYLIVFSIFSSFLADSSITKHEFILDTILWISVLGSILSIAAFFVLDIRPSTQWYIFGLPAFGVYYATAKYAMDRQWYHLAVLLVFLIRIVVGQSRSMYLFIPLAAILTLFITIRLTESTTRLTKRDVLTIASVTGLPIVFSILVIPDIQNRIASIAQLSSGFLARPARWIAGINVFQQHPFGIGLGNYSVAVQEFAVNNELRYPDWFIQLYGQDDIAYQLSKYQSGSAGPHSDFFSLLVGLGFVGAALLILFFSFLFRHILNCRSDPISLSLTATMIYFVFQQLVNSQLFAGSGGIVLVLFLAIFSTYKPAVNNAGTHVS